MTNKELKTTAFALGIMGLLANLGSALALNKWYPIVLLISIGTIIFGFFVPSKDPKKKRRISNEELKKLPYKIDKFIPENKPHNSFDFVCAWTKTQFSGLPVTYQDYKEDSKDDYCTYQPIGQICPNCGSVSYETAKESGMAFSDWDGYESIKCNSCNNDDIEPIIILNC
ncbi:MAG: hypothetical protein CMO82_12670 [Winogradskyella sp.]|uniref:MFS transporter n=1 Tax=Winogradskyella poriferorum TaxID=307627 RepID=A0ABU7W2J9_9FLAO|nr:hypothetical protein [Winogradskyella sp.]|tara:strand:- start:865 stop:1374 length:510 start_codon:yes stop_codon:yes gene_type:complete